MMKILLDIKKKKKKKKVKNINNNNINKARIKLQIDLYEHDDDDDNNNNNIYNNDKKKIIKTDSFDSMIDNNYNTTLYAINAATQRTERKRQNSYSQSHSIHNNRLSIDKDETGYPLNTISPKKHSSLHQTTFYYNYQPQRLMINVKVNSAKINDDNNNNNGIDNDEETEITEEFIGGFKLKIDVSENTSKFHQQIITQNLKIRNRKKIIKNNKSSSKSKFIESGTLSMRVYLNVLHKYDKYGLKYIDIAHKNK